jgi:formylglycine-generating enzyme required for sulfatase activity
MKILSFLLPVQLFLLFSLPALSNNILVENVSLEGQIAAENYVFIEFDLSWDNSWRTVSVPGNWDAAWIFCKYRLAGGEWQHVYLHPTGHEIPVIATLSVAADTTGAFIYRNYNGNGSNNWDNLRLRWDYGYQGINDDATLEVIVFAIEMVYVPGESYYLGDSTSTSHFYSGGSSKSFYQVTSENPITVSSATGNLWADGSLSSGTIPLEYPKGFQPFYMMKYEFSQEQYTEFLNTLTRTQQNTRTATDISGTNIINVYVMTNQSGVLYRNNIRCDATLPATGPVTFYNDYNENGIGNETDDGQNIACNYLSWGDIAAYLDWSGLRPYTELEFEKACRGPNNPVGGEFAWGNPSVCQSKYTILNEGQPDEVISSMPEDSGNCLYSVTYHTFGFILRCGIFAASSVSHTRMASGASYYGIMEMSGNVGEKCVNAFSLAGRSFTGLHGNGILLATGDADVDYWPGINGNDSQTIANTTFQTAGITSYGGAGIKGIQGNFLLNGMQISSRVNIHGADLTFRTTNNGGRGCRTAP